MGDMWLSEGSMMELVAEAPPPATLRDVRRTLRRAAVLAGLALAVAAVLSVLRTATRGGEPRGEMDWEEGAGM